MRSDALKNLELIAGVKMRNPKATQQDLVRETGLGINAVKAGLKKLKDGLAKSAPSAMSKTQAVIAISQKDLDIVALSQDIQLLRMRSPSLVKDIKTADLVKMADIAQKRHSLIMGEQTDEKGASKEKITIEYIGTQNNLTLNNKKKKHEITELN